MSLLGVDVGTSGCKASAFAADGRLVASAYEEYDCQRPEPGWAELDAEAVWRLVKDTIAAVTDQTRSDPVEAISVSSLGEAVVPVSADRRILGPSILNFDARGEAYLPDLAAALDPVELYAANGNTLGNHYTLTKLLWLRDHQPDLFDRTHRFLHWSGFVSFMLGADPAVDFSLANRTLLFDLEKETWSEEILSKVGLNAERLPKTVSSGSIIGTVSDAMAEELAIPRGALIAAGAHDQCANAVGCGVTEEGAAMFGMGTYICIAPVFRGRRDPALMIERGLNTEHHAAPGRFVSFIYNHGGSLVKWYRDTFAASEHRLAKERGTDVYDDLFAKIPDGPSGVTVLPHFSATGPPEFITDSSGVMAGLRLDTTRGHVLKGIIEGAAFYLRQCVESLPATGIAVNEFRAVGGGSKSERWLQVCADIFGRPFARPRVTEAGALGAAILAGTALGTFQSCEEGAAAMVSLDHTVEPNPVAHSRYDGAYAAYTKLWPTLREWLTGSP